MSTYWYFECMNHEPPLQSNDEFTQHTDDRHYDRAVQMVANRPLISDVSDFYPRPKSDAEITDNYFEGNARAFLVNHPTCRIEFVSEYDIRRPSTKSEGATND